MMEGFGCPRSYVVEGCLLLVGSPRPNSVLYEGPDKVRVEKDSYDDDYQGLVHPAQRGTRTPP